MTDIASIKISRAGIHDLQQLRGISISTFQETFAASNTEEDMNRYLEESMTEKILVKELETSGSEFYMAFWGQKPVGYLKINTGNAQTEIIGGNTLEIERIYVLNHCQGKNIGHQLMERVFGIAAGEDIKTIWLGVWEHNRKAISFYQKYGFQEFDKHVFRLGNDEQTDILMKVILAKNNSRHLYGTK